MFPTGTRLHLDKVKVKDVPAVPRWRHNFLQNSKGPCSSRWRSPHDHNGRRRHLEDRQVPFQIGILGNWQNQRGVTGRSPTPTDKTQPRSFLDLFNVYRRFIDYFNVLTHPLDKNQKKGALDSFNFEDEQRKSIDSIVNKISAPSVLALPITIISYYLDCDSSDYGIGCELSQRHHDVERKPIGFWSRLLLPAEELFFTSEWELLAVDSTLKKLRAYLMYEKLTVDTDHASFHWLLNINDQIGRLIIFRRCLSKLGLYVKYKKVKENTQAN